MLYGYHQHQFIQSIRDGVWRPTVFMSHGLEVSLWLATGTLIGICLFKSKILSEGFTLIGIAIMGITTIISQSWGAILLLLIGASCLFTSSFLKKGLPLIILFIFPTLYLANRISNLGLEKSIIETSRRFLPLRRFRSINFRLDQEARLVNKANEKMFLGWGRFGRSRIYQHSKDISVTDSAWIIQYGQGGLISLIPFVLIFTIPVIGLYKIAPPASWQTKNMASSAVLAVSVGALLIDLMFNDFYSSIHFIIAGALSHPYNDNKNIKVIISEN